MSEFASRDQCWEVLDAIADLIPPKNLRDKLSQIQKLGGKINVAARIGSARQNRHHSVEFNPLIPRAWSADIHDHRYDLFSVFKGKETERYRRSANHPLHRRLGAFSVYGLDIYDADSSWNNIVWEVVEPLSQKGEQAIFIGGSGLGPGGRISAERAGHAACDTPEEDALGKLGDSRNIFGESMAHINSLRLTGEGTEFLLGVLCHTKVFELTNDASMIQPRQLQLEV